MKKKIVLASMLLIMLSIAGYGTMAYFTAEGTATNVITTGDIGIEIKETSLDESGEEVPFVSPVEVMPSTVVSKIVRVVNIGGQDAFIRVSLSSTVLFSDQQSGVADPDLVYMDINRQAWQEKDGFYYYKEPVAPGQETEPLFKKVTFAPEMDNQYMHTTFTVDVNAQATQVANNGSSAIHALGWPAE